MYKIEQLWKVWSFFNIPPNGFRASKNEQKWQKLLFIDIFTFSRKLFGLNIKYCDLKFWSVKNMHRVEHLWNIWWFSSISLKSFKDLQKSTKMTKKKIPKHFFAFSNKFLGSDGILPSHIFYWEKYAMNRRSKW